jgi:hypothetical protein
LRREDEASALERRDEVTLAPGGRRNCVYRGYVRTMISERSLKLRLVRSTNEQSQDSNSRAAGRYIRFPAHAIEASTALAEVAVRTVPNERYYRPVDRIGA